jgi:UDP-N-acetylmuramoyl-L-alanyl-D-glutamate--2,6-diaminopimelate ligase
MRLSHLAGSATAGHDPEITGLTADSRAVKPGYLFAALPGVKADGTQFIKAAVAKGAVAILGSKSAQAVAEGLPFVASENPRKRLAEFAARFYGRQPDTIVAVTGTNGKTSVASFVRQIWTALGHKAASFGTVGVVSPASTKPLSHTTPDPVEIHRLLAELHDEGVTHVAFEASSHGLAQYRVDGVRLRAAGFTNLTRDHLDYHETLDDYRIAKLRLFHEVLLQDGVAVINSDSPEATTFALFADSGGRKLLLVGNAVKEIPWPEGKQDLELLVRVTSGDGQEMTVKWQGKPYSFKLPLAGAFQASNALVAAGLVLATGGDAARVFEALGDLKGAAGRLEKIGVTTNDVPVYVDYAHTPDALETVLKALRPHTSQKLWVVFGCGGDRDAGKRPLMGAAAAQFADEVIVTDDNPRTEDAAVIRKAVLEGVPRAMEIADRAKAIAQAVISAQNGDVVVIAGKGHEAGQIVGREVLPFNDADEVRGVIARMSKG